MDAIAGFVLCGGASRRMGTDKALLPFRGRTLVEHVAAVTAEAIGRPATLVGPAEKFHPLGLEVVAEPEPGLGPLGGIVCALALRRAEKNFTVACDMPGLEAGLVRQLLAATADSESLDGVVPAANGRLGLLCAVWRPSALPVFSAALEARRLRVADAANSLKIKILDVNPALLANANTPEEWLLWSA